ncbi:MAG: hypothetical protein ACTHQM_23150 [Thermoanaerobaculia bacterium]
MTETSFQIVAVCPPPSPWPFLFTIACGVYVVTMSIRVFRAWRRREHQGWRTLLWVLLPVSIGALLTGYMWIRVERMKSLIGGGGAATSAGMAEALLALLIGTFATALLAGVCALVARSIRRRAIALFVIAALASYATLHSMQTHMAIARGEQLAGVHAVPPVDASHSSHGRTILRLRA